MSWRRKEPGHQQPWYWPSQTEITRSPHVKVIKPQSCQISVVYITYFSCKSIWNFAQSTAVWLSCSVKCWNDCRADKYVVNKRGFGKFGDINVWVILYTTTGPCWERGTLNLVINFQGFSGLSIHPLAFLYQITVTSYWARWRHKLPASRLFIQPFVQAHIKEHIETSRHSLLWPVDSPSQRANNAENVSIWWRHHEFNIYWFSLLSDINECASFPCLFGGTCFNNISRFDCACPPGTAGARCELSKYFPHQDGREFIDDHSSWSF